MSRTFSSTLQTSTSFNRSPVTNNLLRLTPTKIGSLRHLAPQWAARPLLQRLSAALAAPSAKMDNALRPQHMDGLSGPTAQKLHGRAFYESIGSPKMIVAPMVDRSEFVGTSASIFPQHPLTIAAGLANAHTLLP